ncbi:MAG: S1 RNA-binding domain-containing protein [Bacteroidota bacterium]|nr:S1 RNA-binding domain-containing protein [Bacteroidota bacterium]
MSTIPNPAETDPVAIQSAEAADASGDNGQTAPEPESSAAETSAQEAPAASVEDGADEGPAQEVPAAAVEAGAYVAETTAKDESEVSPEDGAVEPSTPELAESVPTSDEDTAGPASVQDDDEASEPAPEKPSAMIGYTGVLTGEVIKLEELEARQQEHEEESVDADRLASLIDASVPELMPQTIVAGTIAAVSDRDVIVNVGFKSDAVVSRNEFGPELKVGDEVEVFVERMENHWGQLVLSKLKADQVRRWQTIEKSFKEESVLEGVILRRIKGGMIVDLLDGLEAFLPGSQIDVRPVRDFDAYVDQRMEFKIVKINPSNENVVVSHKALIERGLAEQRESILSTMEKGQILEGKAKNITDFGVFVDLGGVDGLLHITDLSWGRVAHPTEVVQIDDDLKVVVLDYDRERRRISLGLKQLLPHPWEKVKDNYKKGDHLEGKVVSITDYGAFVELERGIEGLVHISEMSWTDHIRHPSQKVSLGQIVKVGILNIDPANKKISLGMKQFELNPWEGLSQRTPPGTVLRGRVRHFQPYGAFVEIEPGVEGLIHITDLSWTKRPNYPSEILRKGQEVSVVVLDIDEGRQRISLGHKQIQTNPWANLSSVYAEGTDHQAKVSRIDARRLLVALPYDVEGIVPGSELKFRGDNIYANYTKGDMLDLRVIRIDPSKKEVVLSETAKDVQAARKARDERQRQKLAERKQQERAVRQFKKKVREATGPTTLGELSDLKAIHDRMVARERKENNSGGVD